MREMNLPHVRKLVLAVSLSLAMSFTTILLFTYAASTRIVRGEFLAPKPMCGEGTEEFSEKSTSKVRAMRAGNWEILFLLASTALASILALVAALNYLKSRRSGQLERYIRQLFSALLLALAGAVTSFASLLALLWRGLWLLSIAIPPLEAFLLWRLMLSIKGLRIVERELYEG